MPMAAKLEEMKVAEGTRRELTAPELIGRKPRVVESDS